MRIDGCDEQGLPVTWLVFLQLLTLLNKTLVPHITRPLLIDEENMYRKTSSKSKCIPFFRIEGDFYPATTPYTRFLTGKK